MALRFNSLKTRMALVVAVVIMSILSCHGLYLILTKQKELRQDIEQRALLFAQLTRAPICVGYDTYYSSGYYKFRELVRDHLRLAPDVESLAITNVNGRVLFDSADVDEPSARGEVEGRSVSDPEQLEAIKRLEPTLLRGHDAAGRQTLEVVAPYIEDWGRHRLTVLYRISYKNLRPSVIRLAYAALGLALTAIAVSVLVAFALASRITRPLEELTRGAQGIAEGNFGNPLAIRSGDEMQILADAFNHMTARLKANVDELEESNKKLAMVNEELKELDRMKSDLLANVSHELRTPLTAIKGYTDYILEGKLGVINEKQEKGLVVVQRNLDRLARSINALLDFSRMEMGRVSLNLQPFALPQLVEQIHTSLRSELEKKGVSFAMDFPADLPGVIADRDKISQVVENLVINAVKFTPEGGRITVSARRSRAGGRPAAEIQVRDTGIGIPRSQLGKIFVRFHQVDGSTTRRFGGVGLGLAIVKSILDAHGAPIAVESTEGAGTTFRFCLPVLERVEGTPRTTPPGGRPTTGIVLVVSDEPAVLGSVADHLEDKGLAVRTASHVSEACDVAVRERPHLILVDLLLADGSALDLLRTLKEDPMTRSTPVLVVSAGDQAPGGGVALRAAECLTKPPERGPLLQAVRRNLDPALRRTPAALVIDEPETAEFLRSTLEDEGFTVAVAHDGNGADAALAGAAPDLLLLGMTAPGVPGLKLLEDAGRNERGTCVPVVVLTGRGETGGGGERPRRTPARSVDPRALVAQVLRYLGERTAVEGMRRTTS
jgi:signal transduction histidine kinase/DNA-binding response OmpR family regulator